MHGPSLAFASRPFYVRWQATGLYAASTAEAVYKFGHAKESARIRSVEGVTVSVCVSFLAFSPGNCVPVFRACKYKSGLVAALKPCLVRVLLDHPVRSYPALPGLALS